MDKFVELTNVSKHFDTKKGRFQALSDVNLSIAKGEFVSLIGHSGCGKSTVLNLIAGLLEASEGGLICNGREIDGPGPERAVVFQNHSLLPWMTCFGNVHLAVEKVFAGKENKVQLKERTAAALHMVGLDHAAHKHPNEISGGMKQRVGIARALATEPKILLCDEATSALDPQTTAQVLQLLAEINRELGLTIVLITHEMDVIRRVCDQVAVMDGGQIVEQGPVAQVFLHPQHATTKRFVQEDEHIDEDEQRDDFAHVQGRILRLTFQGEATYAPLLGTVARETGVDYSILAGRIDRIKDSPYGQLTLALTGGDIDAALARFQAADVHLEVLR
jgi:D-methionine transport system ATP-binding protein